MKKFVNVLMIFGAFCAACFLNSCNVTRTMVNESRYFQRGDTAVMIQTKTVETYDARKHLNYVTNDSRGLPTDNTVGSPNVGTLGLPGAKPEVGRAIEKTLLRAEQVTTARNLRSRPY